MGDVCVTGSLQAASSLTLNTSNGGASNRRARALEKAEEDVTGAIGSFPLLPGSFGHYLGITLFG